VCFGRFQDIAPRWAGILFGVTNACASIIGIGGIIGTGAFLSSCLPAFLRASLPLPPLRIASGCVFASSCKFDGAT